MKALVIGASGLLGRCLVRILATNGVDVDGTYYSRPGTELQPLDVRVDTDVREAVGKSRADVVFVATDVPARSRRSLTDGAAEARASLVDGTRNVARAARDAGALLVFYSTTEVFSGSGFHSEDDPVAPSSHYGRLKAEAEAIIAAEGGRSLIIRTGELFGWDRTATDPVQELEGQLRSGGAILLSAARLIQPTLVDYLAEGSLRLVQTQATGIVHLAGGDRLSELDFARLVAQTLLLNPEMAQPANQKIESSNPNLACVRIRDLLGTEPMALDEAMKRLRRQWRGDTYTGIVRASVTNEAEQIKEEIFERVQRYYELVHKPKRFIPFESRVNYAGRYFDATEMVNLADSMLDFWLTLGPYGDLFETKMKRLLRARDFALVNSGSSANLTAISALCSPLVNHHMVSGDEVITPAVTFPTTLAPILQNGLVPVFVDCEIGTYNIDVGLIEAAVSQRTRALVIPHTLGNPCDLDTLRDIAARHQLWLMEDTCDALGGTFDGQPVGTFGDLGTLSFYPAHHITMGEGGGVIVNNPTLSRAVRSIRDWGRDCWCAPGESNTCARRFGWCLGELPTGYDHKYIYSGLGFNLKPTDMQAAIGAAQIDKLPEFVERRRHNFSRLYDGLSEYQDRLILPTWHPKAEPSWFGFPITVREGIRRDELIQWLESANIETRLIFAGNILRQPGYRDIPHRIAGSLETSDRVMRDTFFVGVYPGITDEMIEFMLDRFRTFLRR